MAVQERVTVPKALSVLNWAPLHKGVWGYSTYSSARYQMDGRGQLHTPAALTPEKQPSQCPLHRSLAGPQTQPRRCGEGKISCRYQELIPDSSVVTVLTLRNQGRNYKSLRENFTSSPAYHFGICTYGWGTTLQAGRSQVLFQMRSLDFSIDLFLPAALWPLGRLSL
jgi:hypothetical protein